MKKLIIVGFICTQWGAFLGNFSAIAQINPLADTNWDGNAEISVPVLVWKNERPSSPSSSIYRISLRNQRSAIFSRRD